MSDTETLSTYRRALDSFAVIHAVPAALWEVLVPCDDWRAIDVAGHVIGGQQMIRAFASVTALPPWGERPTPLTLVGDDAVTSWGHSYST